jgi:hypothetical protein
MSAVLTAAPEPNDDAEQLAWIDGFPAAGQRFTLKSVANLWTEDKLDFEQQVKGQWRGVVEGVHTTRSKDGNLLYVYDVRVDDADLET